MEKRYTFDLTDEELMHILIASDAWCSGQKEKAHKAHLKHQTNAEELEKRYSTAAKLVEKLIKKVSEQNPNFDMREMWEKIMFDI